MTTPDAWARMSVVFADVASCPPDEREARLAALCADAPDLRRAIRRLLEAHHNGAWLEVPAQPVSLASTPADRALDAGSLLGPYRVVREVGQGGMGRVYEGWDTRLERAVAIKSVLPSLGPDARGRDLLAREARTTAAVRHPNVAAVYALHEHAQQLYLIAEFVDGRTLRDVLHAGRIPSALALHYARAIARGLEAVHTRGIVHGDLKPENILVARDDIKLVDFGLSRLMPEHGASLMSHATRTLWQSQPMVGTPLYMAPERLRGERPSTASDIFALGVVLYELLSGRHPFERDDLASTLVAMLDGTVEPQTSPTQDAALNTIILCCLSQEPVSRPAQVREVCAALEAAADSTAGVAASALMATPRRADVPRARASAPRWWLVHQVAAAAIVTLVLYPVWAVRWWPEVRPQASACFFVALLTATTSVALRLHGCFAVRVAPRDFVAHWRRIRRVVVGADLLYAGALVCAAALAYGHDPSLSALLTTVAVGLLVASLIIEPFTTRAEFHA